MVTPKTAALNIQMHFSVSHSRESGSLVMVSEAKGRLFRRKDGKYLLYIPKTLAEDSMFPFQGNPSVMVKISFEVGDKKLIVEKWKDS